MSSRSILLKNGVALLRDGNGRIVPTRTSVLVENDRIAKIAKDIDVGQDADIIDCTDKIISPGFVDTHHHAWQTQLKGRHANELLLQYMISGNAQSFQYNEKDIFYGQLAGLLEALAAGTTTILDHAHLTYSPAHARNAISATVSSGMRLVYAYVPITRLKSFNPLTYVENSLEAWVMDTFEQLASEGPWGNGRVTLGFGFDSWFLPREVIADIFGKVKKAAVKTVTVHWASSPQIGGGGPESIVKILKKHDLLDERVVLSHANGCTKEDADLIRGAGAYVSSTPSTELQMAMGRAVCFDGAFVDGGLVGDEVGLQDVASLGIDCHSNNAGSIISEARLGLQSSRNYFNDYYRRQGKTPHNLPENLSVEAAFNLATVEGAKALHLEKEIGSIAEGYKADLVLFDAMSPSMVGAAQHDPVAAIILHSSPADIDTVIVDGIIRKRGGRLLDVAVDEFARGTVGQESLTWSEVAHEVVKSRARIQSEIEKIDFDEGLRSMKGVFYIDENVFVE
ncbi:Metallo-dependent hydrolase [Aaosphaeria arxii CBS 175.79]|uniref:Metallo-dependent hydrolase n=1 Tax=Aaosphaeria arxii CBS 175.79 TaxID=1450172 RepID=A0A6A5XYM3_9PLEO|nr:Metallo-dependent hydrolase [Aaosphaeria arxii CBS 175.79]KAF2017811.1 Metallo-dependent hydrolase [Aaosphaeria arxii CBS 175.79]